MADVDPRRFVLMPRRQGKAQAFRDAVEIARKLGWDVDIAHADGTIEHLRKSPPALPREPQTRAPEPKIEP